MWNGRLTLLAIAVTGALASTPAHAAGCTPGAVDKPDLGFVDSNCDGIDGDKAAAIFVAPNGNDANSGSFGSPKATMQAAIDTAMAAGKDVYAAAGLYSGKVAIIYNDTSVGVYGGYDPQTWQRSAANVTTIQAAGQAVGIANPGIVLQLLTLSSTTNGTSTGVRAWDTGTSVALSRVTIVTADGLKGVDGAAAPAAPATAPNGNDGYTSNGGCPGNGAQGGRAADVNWGGDGGAAWDTEFPISGSIGMDDGSANPTVVHGIGGLGSGQNGGPGGSGTNGAPGQGGSAALTYAEIFYKAMPGADGTGGTRGAGGGGGAGSAEDACTVGGGGGAGGRAGTVGGKAGQGGGGSIGVFAGAGARVLLLDGTAIHTGNGGKGGSGATGQFGGAGGAGGKGASRSYGGDWVTSGAGGAGGYGGHAGQGGGGAGGASLGVLTIDARAQVGADTAITVGSGGAGGYGAYNGQPGVAQKAAQVTRGSGTTPPPGDFDGDGISDDSDSCPTTPGANNGCPADAPSGPVAGDPTATAPEPSAPGSGAVASVAVLPPASSCVAKRLFTVRINVRKAHIRTARLTLDGHRLRVVKGRTRWTARIDLRHSARTRHTLTIKGRLRSGRSFKQTRHYRTCATP